jgi:hypothetical protein
MDELLAQVAEIRNNTVSQSSKKVYITSNVRLNSFNSRLIYWLRNTIPHLLNPTFVSVVEQLGGWSKKNIKAVLMRKAEVPLHFEEITAQQFMAWIVSLETTTGEKPGYSTYNSHR